MARITKDPAERRDELLDIALGLCREHGFETMNVEQVTRAAGVAKGTFYHYFASKEEMLEQLVQRFGDALFQSLVSAVPGAGATGAERLRAIMNAAAEYKLAQADIAYASFLYHAGNLPLRHRLFATWRGQARHVLMPVIRDGVADGSFSVVNADCATDIVLMLWFDAADQLWERALLAPDADSFVATMLHGAAAIYQAQERVLGLPDGTFELPEGSELIALTTQLFHSIDRNHP
ncbi:TetR/AcrR family transcriptional regulator [Propionicimonas sp.]|uniref:TetR/AcrR family transcriptional regulator n=1 Tax=Propionicimonas sp. TaxID=1955623 RepID=UPI0039E34805